MFNEEQLEIRDLARDFVMGEIRPHVEAWDAAADLPDALFEKLAETGFLGVLVPEEHGGLGLDFTTFLLVIEELARGDASVALSVAIHNGPVAWLLSKYASPEQQAHWLPRMASGEVLGAFALSEASAGSDSGAVETTARRDGDDWVIDGRKAWVTNGQRAGVALVWARTGSPRELSCFAVPCDAEGWQVERRVTTMGVRASQTVDVALNGVRVPGNALVGELGRGQAHALEALVPGRLGIAALAVGIGRAALEYAVDYVREREQFSRPLAQFGATQAKLAEMAARVSGARAAMHEAGRRMELVRQGHADEGQGAESLAARAAGAKLLASQTAMYAADEAVQLYGGYGYMRDYPVERLMRDAKGTEIFEGTSEVLKVVIARSILEAAEQGH